MFKKKLLAIIIILSLIVGVYIFINRQEETILKIKDAEITVDLAITADQKKKGLSGREKLLSNEGMLFVYEQPKNISVWMKDMNFSLDIIWINEKKEIIYIEEDVSPETYPESFGPARPVSYFLEVNSGFVEKNDLQIGDKVEFEL